MAYNGTKIRKFYIETLKKWHQRAGFDSYTNLRKYTEIYSLDPSGKALTSTDLTRLFQDIPINSPRIEKFLTIAIIYIAKKATTVEELERLILKCSIDIPEDIYLPDEVEKCRELCLFENNEGVGERTGKEFFDIGFNLSGKYLMGENEVIDYMDYLLKRDLRQQLRAVIYGAVKSPEPLGDKIAICLHDLKSKGIYVKYTVIFVLHPSTISPGFFAVINDRLTIYDELDIHDRLELRILLSDKPAGIDFVTVDNKHLILTIADVIGNDLIYKAIMMENQAEMVANFTSWFDKTLYAQSNLLDDMR